MPIYVPAGAGRRRARVGHPATVPMVVIECHGWTARILLQVR